jgi:hypothetical protein
VGFFDRLFGSKPERIDPERNSFDTAPESLSDEQAVARYRYMLRTAPPELIEQAHEEAFAKLTPEQRSMVLRELSAALPDRERAVGSAGQSDPRSLARMATRAELRQPGTLERTFGGMGYGMGGGMFGGFGGSFLSSLAGAFVGSMIAQQFFDGLGYDPGFADSQLDQQVDAGEPDVSNGDPGGFGDDLGGDVGGDFGDFDASL